MRSAKHLNLTVFAWRVIWFLSIPFITISAALIATAIENPATVTVITNADCLWAGSTFAFIDENANGKHEQGEPPLAGVAFHVDDVLNKYVDVGYHHPEITDEDGKGWLSVWLPGCPEVALEVYTVPSDGYVLTTPDTVPAQHRSNLIQHFAFGFRPAK